MASYRVDVSDEVRRETRQLPGNVRQRVIRQLRALEQQARPGNSRVLETERSGVDLQPGVELRRIRLASWRIVYLVEDSPMVVTVLAIRKRPPYQYDDLGRLLRGS